MPKKLVGGVFLLCLTALILTLSIDGETYTNITQPEILEQLTNLKNYISNPSMIKPVWVQLNNGDEIVVVQGELKVVDTGEFEICVKLNGYKLVISIEFTQATLDDDTPIDDWYIDTNDAKYLFTSDAQNVKATIENEDFGDVALAGDLSVGGDLSVTGKVNGKIAFEDIEDAQGHKRFVEDDGVPLEQEGFTSIYCKWSLSGSHLMLVLAGTIIANTTITNATTLAQYNLPEWIRNKIYGVQQNLLEYKSIICVAVDYDQQTMNVYFDKNANGVVLLANGEFTATKTCAFRVELDLLIDNASA